MQQEIAYWREQLIEHERLLQQTCPDTFLGRRRPAPAFYAFDPTNVTQLAVAITPAPIISYERRIRRPLRELRQYPAHRERGRP